jgi:5,10-methenyltetrahydrofolate synthetase
MKCDNEIMPEQSSPRSPAEITAWKKATRTEILQAREALSPDLHRQYNQRILDALSSNFGKLCSGVVGMYWPYRNEVDVRPFADFVLAQGGSAALPVVVAKKHPLEFHAWKPGDAMVEGAYGILRPAQDARVEPDVLIVPLVGFDSACYRLGYGGGFYDRTLSAAAKKPITIAVSFELARLESTRPQSHDMPMDFVVTETNVLQRRS